MMNSRLMGPALVLLSLTAFSGVALADRHETTFVQNGATICKSEDSDPSTCVTTDKVELTLTCVRMDKTCAHYARRDRSAIPEGYGRPYEQGPNEVCIQYNQTLVDEEITATIYLDVDSLVGQRTFKLECGPADQGKLFLSSDDQNIQIKRKLFFPSRRFKVQGN